jgi:hypothetical protein
MAVPIHRWKEAPRTTADTPTSHRKGATSITTSTTRCHTILEQGEDDCESVDTTALIAMIHNDAAGEEEET